MQCRNLMSQNKLFKVYLINNQLKLIQKGTLLIKKDNKFSGVVILEQQLISKSGEKVNKVNILGPSQLNGALHNCVVGVEIDSKYLKQYDLSQNLEQKMQQQSLEDSKSSDYETISESEITETESEDEFPEFIQQEKQEKEVPEFLPKLHGKIVKIFENPYLTKLVIGKIKQSEFIPLDEKLPMMKCLNFTKFFEKNGRSEKLFYLGQLYSNNQAYIFPKIELIKQFALTGETQLDLETNAILYDLEIPTEEYSKSDIEYLQSFPPIEEEIANRQDLTKEIVFTIDPINARDLDDSLSVKQIQDDIYEVSVHISDVSYYLSNQTKLDNKARIKTTSFYLPHKMLPMLPEQLSSGLCSLTPGEKKLTITCAFMINANGEVEDNARMFQSAINSKAKMSYQMAQEIIEGKDTWETWKDNERLKVSGEQEFNSLVKDLKTLNHIAQNRKAKRIQNGSIVINNNQFYFELDKDSMPTSYSIDQRKEANFLVEEFMLLANQFIGKFLVDNCKPQALLRNHPKPLPNSIQFLKELAQKLDLPNKNINEQNITQFIQETIDNANIPQQLKNILLFKLMKNMRPALYFIVGNTLKEEWHHFALNFDVYTHFTSPIRRYPDVIVHRLLTNILQNKPKLQKKEIEEYSKLMDTCNKWKLTSRKLQERCSRLFMCLYLKDKCLFAKAYILEIMGKNCFNIVVPMLNLERSINLKNSEQCKYQKIYNKAHNLKELDIVFDIDEKQKIKLKLKSFMELYVMITSNNQFPLDYVLSLAIPKTITENISQDESLYYILK